MGEIKRKILRSERFTAHSFGIKEGRLFMPIYLYSNTLGVKKNCGLLG
jgi:hypothetical protein